MYSILGGGGSPESKTARTVEEGYVSPRRAALARISVCACLMTLGGYFKHFPMQQLSALLQIPSGSDCPHENLFKIGLNSNTRQSSSAMRDSHYYYYIMLLYSHLLAITILSKCYGHFFCIHVCGVLTSFIKHTNQSCRQYPAYIMAMCMMLIPKTVTDGALVH